MSERWLVANRSRPGVRKSALVICDGKKPRSVRRPAAAAKSSNTRLAGSGFGSAKWKVFPGERGSRPTIAAAAATKSIGTTCSGASPFPGSGSVTSGGDVNINIIK